MSEDLKINMFEVLVTSNINSFGSQRRFPSDIKIFDLKRKLELLTGAIPSYMELQLLDDKNQLISVLLDDNSTLDSYDLASAKILHVIDLSQQAGEFEDLSKVKKFVLSDEEYAKRQETFKTFKEKMNIGGGDEKNKETKQRKLAEEESLIKNISVGSRCEVQISGKPNRRGTVMYAGKTDFKPGFWVGVKYDEPLGKNNGSVGGKQYFECLPNYGSFVKPHDVIVGDFPEETLELDEI